MQIVAMSCDIMTFIIWTCVVASLVFLWLVAC